MKGPTYIKDVSTYHSGGGCMIDEVELKTGQLIAITNECVVIFKDRDTYMHDQGEDGVIVDILNGLPDPDPLEIIIEWVREADTGDDVGYLVYTKGQIEMPQLTDYPDAYSQVMDMVDQNTKVNITRKTSYR